ncbi:hypothetical protein [Mesorhizobium retamae]|uniref:Uncharacterized protein n=1 Tax=Mesorhizobium retamae TaxID=2912854 RepID=A0ABS9QRW4_9HYPH|nr:hypothetical protein [Mesorhizobium sp. IRAMC:0171]MCG7509309.1 hypothetical protein [Mesorhizobium sp. IRAMC:0171]
MLQVPAKRAAPREQQKQFGAYGHAQIESVAIAPPIATPECARRAGCAPAWPDHGAGLGTAIIAKRSNATS